MTVPKCGDLTPHRAHNGFATGGINNPSPEPWCKGTTENPESGRQGGIGEAVARLLRPDADYWWEQRYADALWAERVSEGRCGNCGAFDGPTHRCPSVRPSTGSSASRSVTDYF